MQKNISIAEIKHISPHREYERPIGLAKGEFKVTPEFFEPLSDEMFVAFNEDNV